MGATWKPPENSQHLHYQVVDPQPWPRYLEAMSSAEIALMPLEPNPHTDAKSAIKFFEAAAMGAVAVGLGKIYQQTIIHEQTGLLADSPKTFAQHVAELALDCSRRQTIRGQAHKWLQENNLLTHHLELWREALIQ